MISSEDQAKCIVLWKSKPSGTVTKYVDKKSVADLIANYTDNVKAQKYLPFT